MTQADPAEPHLLVFGLGYTGRTIARDAVAAGMRVTATIRTPAATPAPAGVQLVAFDAAAPALGTTTHVVATAPPDEDGDPVIRAYGSAIASSPLARWAGYLSTTGVYGDRGGGWVDEDTPVAPGSDRSRRRVAAEQAWAALLADRAAVDVFRVAGIYGPGRSPFASVREGTAQSVRKPGHAFGRIHRDDIARAVIAACRQQRAPGLRVLHLADDVPAEPADVLAEAAALLGIEPPASVAYEEAAAGMSEMARSFWTENRRIASAKTQQRLGLRWLYPSYREGLAAILAAEQGADRPD